MSIRTQKYREKRFFVRFYLSRHEGGGEGSGAQDTGGEADVGFCRKAGMKGESPPREEEPCRGGKGTERLGARRP